MVRMIIFALLFSSGFAHAAPHTVQLSIDSMACGPDPHNIRAALQTVTGVTDVSVSLETRMATVNFDDEKTTTDLLLQAVASAGFAALPHSEKPAQ